MTKRRSNERDAGLGIALALSLLFLGAGCGLFSERTVYEVARAAVQKDPELPLNATIGPASGADFYIGQSAACVLVPIEFTDASGARKTGTYTVWLDRICIRWEVNRCFRTPEYPPAGA